MKPELRKKIIKFNKMRKEEGEKANALETLLSRLPPGIVKQLYKDPVCAEILAQNGITDS